MLVVIFEHILEMNEKHRMDEVEFEQRITNSIIPLYPDAKDFVRKHVMIKVAKGPDQINKDLVA